MADTGDRRASSEVSAKLSELARPLIPQLKLHKRKFKELLRADLASKYAICYWADDGCYYCSDDGVNWIAVTCIT